MLKLSRNIALKAKNQLKTISTSSARIEAVQPREESERMKQFHEQLKVKKLMRIPPSERFVELLLTNVDPKSGEFIADSEPDPTKWGDWQHNGRVTDF